MNLRHKRKAWKKFQAAMMGEDSGLGKMTAKESRAAIEYFTWHLRQVAKAVDIVTESMKEWPSQIKEAMQR